MTEDGERSELSGEEGGIMVEDEFSEEVTDTGQAEQRTRVLVLKPEEIIADPEVEESKAAPEKVIHIDTRWVTFQLFNFSKKLLPKKLVLKGQLNKKSYFRKSYSKSYF